MDTTPARPAIEVQSIPIDQLKPNPWNRTVFDPQAIDEITQSAKAGGIREPLLVRPLAEGGFQIASGHRRWLAAQKAGLKEVPCLVQALADERVAEGNITLNVQTERIPSLELARMVKGYMEQFKKTQEEAATTFGKTQSWVSELGGFLTLPAEVKENIATAILGRDQLRALKQCPKEVQLQVAKEVKEGTTKPDQVEKRCRQLKLQGSAARQGSGSAKHPNADTPSRPIADPLADLWPPLLANPAIAPQDTWGVSYKGEDIWAFWSKAPSPYSLGALAEWFQRIGQALEGELRRQQTEMAAASTKPGRPLAPSVTSSHARLSKPRLPQTPEEEKELEEIAIKQGPRAVYAWIYGPDSLMVQAVPGSTWAELGITDPIQGLRQVLAGIRKFQESAG
jgi:ParB family transcriptional regulator, chromosome partitioning protein